MSVRAPFAPVDRPSADKPTVADYLEAGTSANTRRAYQGDIRHFLAWGGLLPSSREQLCEYLVAHAGTLSVSTLSRRLVGLSTWHSSQGFADPVNSPVVKKVMRGIRRKHNTPVKKAPPLALDDLARIVALLEQEIRQVGEHSLITADRQSRWLRAQRDRAMLLLGFWRGFRADTLCDLRLEFITPATLTMDSQSVAGLEIYLGHSKTDQEGRGESFRTPAMPGNPLCPVAAYRQWLTAAALINHKGYAFPKFDAREKLTNSRLSPGSMSHWLKRLCIRAGVSDAERYSSHSLRRGLATLMASNGADIRLLMDYVGWKSAASALRYVDTHTEGAELLLTISHTINHGQEKA